MATKGISEWIAESLQNGSAVERRCKPIASIQTQMATTGLDMLTFTLPWPPSVNTYWRSVIVQGPRGPRVKLLISEKGREYRKRVAAIVQQKQERMAPGRYDVWIDAHPPDKRKRDLDNLPKAILDSLAHAGVYVDDGMIDKLSIQRCKPLKGTGMVYVTVRVIG